MPLRGLFYFARLYSSYVETHHQAEVKMMILSYYDEELHSKTLREEGREEGREEERKLFKMLLKENRLDDLRRACEACEYEESLLKEFNL